MNSTQSLGRLHGRIEARLELDEDCSNVGARTTKRSENKSKKSYKVCGLVFIPILPLSKSKEFLLSLPQDLRILACQASILRQSVCVSSYSYIDSVEAGQAGIIPLLEVHSGGMHVDEPCGRSGYQHSTRSSTPSNVWSLRQFRIYESVFAEEMKAKRKQKDKGKEKGEGTYDVYDIVATVDAVSPIVSMEPCIPFALVELYDSNYPEETSILVLQSRIDLICWYGIFPGDTITMRNVRRKSWIVPDMLKKDKKRRFDFLGNRIPSFVFTTVSSSRIDFPQRDYISPIPATTVPLVSLEGHITHVETISTSKMQRLIHWIVVSRDYNERQQGVKLFLTDFPMDTSLQLSLQVGARIRAVNIHQLCDACPVSFGYAIFGACLRSTVSITGMASESQYHFDDWKVDRVPYLRSDSDPSLSDLQTKALDWKVQEAISTCYPVPFRLMRIETTYHDYIYEHHIECWLNENFRDGEHCKLPAQPSGSNLVDSLRKNGKILHRLGPRSTLRNPYAEFFDHGDEGIAPSEMGHTHSGCVLSRYDCASSFQDVFIGLGKIKSVCIESLVRAFDASLRDGTVMKLPGVWSGSIHLGARDILSASITDHSSSEESRLCTGGRVVETRSDCSTPASISDNSCQIPVLVSEKLSSTKGDFIAVRIEKVVVSCLCLRAPKKATSSESEDISKFLSPVKRAFFNDENIDGSCILLRIHGYLLIASLHIVASKPLLPIQKESDEESSQNDARIETIDSVLSDPLLFSNCKTGDYTRGILLRHRFAPKKIGPMGNSQCCTLTICSTTEDPCKQNDRLCGLSHLQTIDDVKLSVSCPENIRDRFTEAFACISGGLKLAEDEYALGACWWSLADSGRTCALTSGGWDELQAGSPRRSQNHSDIRVRIPLSALQLGGRGYVRCSVNSGQIEADYVPTLDMETEHSPKLSESMPSSGSFSGFHFLGGERFRDGMLQRRPPRRLTFGSNSTRPIGPLLYPPPVPAFDIATLFSQLCRSLRERDTNHVPLAPSMVRRISHATFLGVAFCQVQCFCSKCFKPLRSPRPQSHKKRRYEESIDETSFWHLPHPNQSLDLLHSENKFSRTLHIPQPKVPKHIRNSALRCPEGHSAESFGVRWECSGLLDDGTGQAKLYSDGEAALTLLGMDASTIQSIEEGIWSIPGGMIQFKKSMPPPEFLRAKAMDAFLQNRRRKLKNPLSLLEPGIRAEYLLHHHCRSSKEPRRPLEYFVRCKPLSDQIPHLHHTMVESAVLTRSINRSQEYALGTQEVATYSLPQLKLALVDCGIPEENVLMPEIQ